MKAFESKGVANFELIGKAKINKFTFTLESESKNSDWIRNVLNLYVDCGQGNEVKTTLSGGFGSTRDNVCYVHGKKPLLDKNKEQRVKKINGKDVALFTDDYKNSYKIAWEDRFDESVLKDIGEGTFLKVGIVKDKDGKIYTEKFLSAYDAIAYIEKNKEAIDGKTIRVNGNVKYKMYNGNLQIEKDIKSIYVSEVEESKFKAEFTQTVLFEKKSIGKKDKDSGLYDVSVHILESLKDYDGKTIPKEYFIDKKKSANIPLAVNMFTDNENLEKFFGGKNVKRGKISEAIMIGNIVEGKAKESIDINDLDDDIKFLVEQGMYSLEEIAKTTAIKSERVSQWIIKKPLIKMVGDNEDDKKPEIQVTYDKYDEDDILLTFLAEDEVEEDVATEVTETAYVDEDEVKDESNDDDEWLKELE